MEVMAAGLTLVVAVFGGWPVTAGILKLAKSSAVRAVDTAELQDRSVTAADAAPAPTGAAPDAAPATADAAPATAAPTSSVQVLRGGLLIGFLERAAVAVAILAGQPIAIAYVVAIKGLGRYPELKDTPAASERFIIGTLASMLWAASVAVLKNTFPEIG